MQFVCVFVYVILYVFIDFFKLQVFRGPLK
jgi:hypothetical protein